MKFIISGKNITVTDGLKTAVEDKLGKLERYFTPDTEVVVTLSVEKERQKIVQMELLGHNFFVFCNAETDQVNVVYKRKGNTYGLIEPEA